MSGKPTTSELAVLRVLWKRECATVREVHEDVGLGAETGYTSTLKTLQNMLAKGLVTRDSDTRRHVYTASVAERPTLDQIVNGWVDSTFAGSSLALAMQALEARPVGAEELKQLKALVERIEAQEL